MATNPQTSDSYKLIALSNTTLVMLMASIDASIVLISLPAILRGIDLNPLVPANTSYLLWMLMGYILVVAVLVVTFGRIGGMDHLGVILRPGDVHVLWSRLL